MSTFNRLVIVHGLSSTPRHHWYQSIKNELVPHFKSVIIPRMPQPRKPDPDVWVNTLKKALPDPDEDTLFIGHSLGCITILHYLSSIEPERKIGGIVFVSGFVNKIKEIPVVDAFINKDSDYSSLQSRIEKRLVLFSSNDKIVPPQNTIYLSHLLNSKLYCYHNCGHFTQDDGVKDLPHIKELLYNNRIIC